MMLDAAMLSAILEHERSCQSAYTTQAVNKHVKGNELDHLKLRAMTTTELAIKAIEQVLEDTSNVNE